MNARQDRPVDLFSGTPFSLAVLAVYVFAAALFGALLLRDLNQIDANTESVARERGHALFDLVELARDWNALHSGVYVPVTEYTQPNPYLTHTRRDLTTADGTVLTMINPAFMTRQMAELAARKEGPQIHITSLNPIRPANAADPWELQSLQAFNAGAKERLSLVSEGGESVYRYMAPLLVKESCVKCHATQGYKVGEIRGGISVTMPARELLAIRDAQRTDVKWRYAGVFILVSTLLHLVLFGGRRFVGTIQAINREQEATIAMRTRDLAEANAGLAAEVEERRRQQDRVEESESRYRAVVENAADGVFIADQNAILFANARLAEIVGVAADQLVGSDPWRFVHPLDKEMMTSWRNALESGERVASPRRVRLRYANGDRIVYADVFATLIDGSTPGTSRVLATVRDVSVALEAERESQIAAAVFDSAAEAIMVTDHGGTILRVNPAFTAITGYTPREAEGRTPRLFKSGRHTPAFYADMWRELQDKGCWQGEVWNRRRNGETYIEWLSITRIRGGEEHGGFVATFSDITKRKEAEDLMEHKAHHDALTDLPNRLLFRDRLHSALSLARRYDRQIALLYIDLDHFKEVNDDLGHAAGDELLIEAAHRLMASIRESDTVSRLGGDEFAIVLAELTTVLEAEEVAQRVVEAMQRPFELKDGSAHISTSVGIAVFPAHGNDAEALQKHADVALYAVKEGGRNGYRVYSPALGRR
jgi:diguanylate cyclase (GGDEF)-like protein/PAS domain S-box-containing protein